MHFLDLLLSFSPALVVFGWNIFWFFKRREQVVAAHNFQLGIRTGLFVWLYNSWGIYILIRETLELL